MKLHSKVVLMNGTLKSSRHFTTAGRMSYSKEISQVTSSTSSKKEMPTESNTLPKTL